MKEQIIKKPTINDYPSTDSRTYIELDGKVNWEKYAKALDEFIVLAECKCDHSEDKIEKAADEILNKHYSGQSISMEGKNHKRIWFDDALKAMQEYADLFHKEKLREELKAFNTFVLKLEEEGKIPLIDSCINEYLKTKG